MNSPKMIHFTVAPITGAFYCAEQRALKQVDEVEMKIALAASRFQVSVLKASGKTRELIHRRPLASALAGVAAGCLLGGVTGMLVGQYAMNRTQ